MKDINGKAALVTGGARRIGKEICLALARAGARVVIHYNSSAEEAEDVAGSIRALGGRAWTLKADFGKDEELSRVVERASELCGGLNMLINSASLFPKRLFTELTLGALMEAIRMESWSAFDLARSFSREPGAEHVINMLDSRVLSSVDWEHAAYDAGKRLLRDFTRIMALSYAPKICVNAIAPGPILPPPEAAPGLMEERSRQLPLKRSGKPAYVAEAVLYLLTSEFVTGQVLFIDGGLHLTGSGHGQNSYP